MFDDYPFVQPIAIVWFVLFMITVWVSYTAFGLKQRPILNRKFIMRFSSSALLIATLFIIISGILQLLGESFRIFGRSSLYYHTLFGTIFIAAALNHITIHLRDLWRYLKSRW
ncbi:MAG: hypothetical protein Q8Q20_01290 [bacterium]|nr:hypothetical protein [bacterium]